MRRVAQHFILIKYFHWIVNRSIFNDWKLHTFIHKTTVKLLILLQSIFDNKAFYPSKRWYLGWCTRVSKIKLAYPFWMNRKSFSKFKQIQTNEYCCQCSGSSSNQSDYVKICYLKKRKKKFNFRCKLEQNLWTTLNIHVDKIKVKMNTYTSTPTRPHREYFHRNTCKCNRCTKTSNANMPCSLLICKRERRRHTNTNRK